MRKLLPLLLLLLLVAGCATDPGRRWIQASGTVEQVNNTVVDLHTVGTLSDDSLLRMKPSLNTMNAIVERAHDRLPEGGGSFDTLMDAFDAAYAEYLRILAERLAPETE